MTRHDAARKVLIFALWCLTGMPALFYLVEKDIEPWILGAFVAVWILIVNVVAYYLAHWMVPVDRPENLQVKPVGGSWLPIFRALIWMVGIVGLVLVGSVFLGVLQVDALVSLLRSIFRLLV